MRIDRNNLYQQARPGRAGNVPDWRQKYKPRAFFYSLIIVIVFFGIFGHQVLFSKNTIPAFQSITRLPVIRDIRHLIGTEEGLLKGESNDRINALILGQGGPGHPGPYLTDTILLASFKPSTGQVALLSIPRDLVVNISEVGLRRINEANSWGEVNNYPGGGAALAAEVVEETFKLPINYYARIDFNGFIDIIDNLGGVTIDVPRNFTDYEYPDGKFGYQTVSFSAGLQVFDGQQALQYVRSRNSANSGGDFARAHRQHQLLIAAKDKIFSLSTILNPAKITGLAGNLQQHLATNIESWEIPIFLALGKNTDFESVTTKVLDDSPGGPLYPTTTSEGAYVLAPKIADYSELQFIARNIFTIADIRKEQPLLAIENGTQTEGLAQSTATILSSFEFDVVSISNAASQDYSETILLDLSGNTKPHSKRFLENTLQVKAMQSLPETEPNLQPADFVIILGRDQLSTPQASDKTGQSSS